jgi:hypothetical protein
MNGKWIRSFGRGGPGPGEHVRLEDVFLRGDTVFSVDADQFRLNKWLLNGEFLGAISGAGLIDGLGMVEGLFPDGSWLISVPESISPFRPGILDRKASLFRFDPTKNEATFIQEVQWEAVFQRVSAAGPGVRSSTYAVPHFSRSSVAVMGGSYLYSDARGTSLLRVLPGPENSIEKEIPLPLTVIPASDADRQAFETESLGRLPTSYRPRFRGILKEMGSPEFLPTITHLVSSTDGSVWAGRFVRSGDPHREWFVISDAGEFVDHIRLPADFYLMDASPGRVLGLETNELGVEFLVVYSRNRGVR